MSIPLNPASTMRGGYTVFYGLADNPQWRRERPGLLDVEYAGLLGKVGLDSQAGWVAFNDAGGDWVFTHQFSVTPGAEYPDTGSTVEVWTQGPGVAQGVDFSQEQLRGQLMEMEVLGPLVDLAPGESSSLDLVWAACRCPGKIVDVTRYACCGRPLELRHHGDGWQVQGAWGVFESGRVQLRPLGESDVLLERSVSPMEPLILDHDVKLPARSAAVELVLVTGAGESVRLDSASATAG
jgi:hypothetical protein